MAGFIVLWRVLGVTNFKAYEKYCEKCNRPLRENEYHSVKERDHQGSTSYASYCTLCDARTLGPTGVFWYRCIGFAVFVCIVILVVGKPQRAVEYAEVGLVMFLLILPIIWWWDFKCKKIYNRWVKQHGTDPDKWPGAPKSE